MLSAYSVSFMNSTSVAVAKWRVFLSQRQAVLLSQAEQAMTAAEQHAGYSQARHQRDARIYADRVVDALQGVACIDRLVQA